MLMDQFYLPNYDMEVARLCMLGQYQKQMCPTPYFPQTLPSTMPAMPTPWMPYVNQPYVVPQISPMEYMQYSYNGSPQNTSYLSSFNTSIQCVPSFPGPSFSDDADLHSMPQSDLINAILKLNSGRTYQIIKYLAKGTFGKTYKVWNFNDQCFYAMKIVHHVGTNKRRINKYEILMAEEVSKNSTDRDPLLRMVECSESETTMMIVSKMLHQDLNEFQNKNRGPKHISFVQKVAHQLISAIGKLHSIGLVHTDLKWSNVMLVGPNSAEIKVIDYGGMLTKDRLDHLQGVEVIQTPTHRSPEAYFGLPLGEKMDLWSIGVMLLELYTGKQMFTAFNEPSTVWAFTQLFGMNPEFPRGFHFHKYFQMDQDGHITALKQDLINKKELLYQGKNFDELYLYGTSPAKLRTIDLHFQDLIKKLLSPTPQDRISAREALQHPFFFCPINI